MNDQIFSFALCMWFYVAGPIIGAAAAFVLSVWLPDDRRYWRRYHLVALIVCFVLFPVVSVLISAMVLAHEILRWLVANTWKRVYHRGNGSGATPLYKWFNDKAFKDGFK